MEIARPFIRLPYSFDAARLAEEAEALPAAAWMPHPLALGGNSAIPLVSRDGGNNDDFNGRMCVTPYAEACPYLRQAMAAFGEVLGRSRFMRLAAGCEVSEHIDFNYHWHTRVRIHIPVVTNPDVMFHCGDERVHMRAGECWIFNSWNRHRVVNAGQADRIHLVIDVAGSARFWQTVRRMQVFSPHEDAKAIEGMLQRVPWQPEREVTLVTEEFNIAPVMSPGEIDGLIANLVADFSQNTDNDPKHVGYYAELLWDFSKDWRAIWHCFGYRPQGWSRYRAAIARIYEQLQSDQELVTQSNGIDVNRVIVQRILRPALALDQYERFLSGRHSS